jgi:hypothetical protein
MSTEMQTAIETTPETSEGDNRNAAGNRRGLAPSSQANLRRGGQPDAVAGESCSSEPDGGILQQLRDMQHVYSRPASEDRTPGQKTCRRWMKSDLPRFMACKNRLEEKHPKSEEPGAEYVRLQLDSRRSNTSLNYGDMVSLVIGIGDGDEAFELLFTPDEFLTYRGCAVEDGLSLWEWIRSGMNASQPRHVVSSRPPG